MKYTTRWFVVGILLVVALLRLARSEEQVKETSFIIIDPRIMFLLRAEAIDYDLTDTGDFLVTDHPKLPGNHQPVIIFSQTQQFAAIEIRQITSFALLQTNPISQKLLTACMKRNSVIMIGAWGAHEMVAKGKTNYALAFSIKVDATAIKASTLRSMLDFVAVTTKGVREEIESGDEIWTPY